VRQIVRVVPGSEVAVMFDRTHLYRVLENLLTNALRYASGGPGSVVVEVVQGESAGVEMHVMDDGPGIAAGDRSKVFEPFFTTSSGGTGLGLYIARELCEANGASLELMEGPGGAHFRISAKGGSWQSSSTVEGVTT
jgi:two-component system sensor histidine kinase PilS (NtrC family)